MNVDRPKSSDRPPKRPRIQALIDSKRLHEQEAAPEQVSALWQKAVESGADAELRGISLDGAIRSAYDAGHLATLALLAAHGLRTSSGPGHHEVAFSAAALLTPETLGDLLPDSIEIRGLRRGSMYDPSIAETEDRDLAIAWMRRTLPAIRAAIVRADRTFASRLRNYP
jgi:hypothetical protein